MSEFCLNIQLKFDLRFSNVLIPRSFSEIFLNFGWLLLSIEIYIRITENENSALIYRIIEPITKRNNMTRQDLELLVMGR